MNTYKDTPYSTLYKRTSNGKIQLWSIYFDGNSYWTVTGKESGKMITSSPTIVTAKSTRTLEEQILSEVNSKVKKKLDGKYVKEKENVDIAEYNLPGFSPMLAKKYEDQKSKIKFPCSAQRKYDGIRLLATNDGMFSRSRKGLTSCTHIQAELEVFFKDNPEAKLDGELYTHEYKEDFEKIVSAVKKTAEKATDEDIKLQKKIQYWVYDAPRINGLVETDSFKDRQSAIAKAFANSKYIKVVETIHNIKDEKELLKLKEDWVADGWEGLMARNTNSPYEGKRSYNLLKWKDFEDSEFEITGVEEGNGNLAGCVGAFILKTEDGKPFKAKLVGAVERIRYLFTHQNEVIGKMGTIRFQNRTSENIPRFPVMKTIRGLKDRSDWV